MTTTLSTELMRERLIDAFRVLPSFSSRVPGREGNYEHYCVHLDMDEVGAPKATNIVERTVYCGDGPRRASISFSASSIAPRGV